VCHGYCGWAGNIPAAARSVARPPRRGPILRRLMTPPCP
jgi:hypothetical protein